MICTKCGKEISNNENFCSYCGQAVKANNKILTIDDTFYMPGRGMVVTGGIENGSINLNDIVTINNKKYEINAIEYEHKLLNSATVGMAVGILFKEAKENELRKGDNIIYEYSKILTIYDTFYISGRGMVVTGGIENGTINLNDIVTINNKKYEIHGIEYEHNLLNSATVGMAVGILFKEAVRNELCKGDIIYKYIPPMM